jgi:hypothetical protein
MLFARRIACVLIVSLATVGCSKHISEQPSSDHPGKATSEHEEPASLYMVIDTVKAVKDPKGGWFSPSLQNVYQHGEDVAQVFCSSGPSLPTGREVTVFYRDSESTPESTACKRVVAVVDGHGTWYKGRAVTASEMKSIMEHEVHFVRQTFGYATSRMTLDWRSPKPIGEPCTDLSGSPADVGKRYKGKTCSIAIVYTSASRNAKLIEFVNWQTMGLDQVMDSASMSDVVKNIEETYGAKYVSTGNLN